MTFQALLFCPDEKTARVTTQILNELEFSVEGCNEPFVAVKKLMGQHFDAIVVDCENEQNASLLFKSARNSASNQGSLAVAVVEGQAGVANAFRVGANLVLTKPINVEQAKSTLRVARGLLRKGTDTKASSVPGPAPVAPSVPKPAPPVAKATPAPVSVATKPSFPAIQKPKPGPAIAATKPSIDAEDLFETGDEGSPASHAAEEPLFESPAEQASAPGRSDSKPVASQEYPWQPISKQAGAMAPSLQRRPESAGKSPAAPAASPVSKAAQKNTLAPEQTLPPTAPMRAQGGAASAPAPAMEVARTSAPLFAGQSAPPEQPSPAITTKPAATFAEPPEPLSAPSFAALDLDDEDTSAGGMKKGILIAVLVVVLGAAAYFGYTKFAGNKQAHPSTPAPSQPQSAAPTETTPQEEEITVGGTATAAQAPPQPTTSAMPARTLTTAKGSTAPAAPSASAKASNDEPEVTVTHADAPKLVVKSDVGTHAPKEQPAPVEAVAPPALSNLGSEDSGTISSLVKSAPVSVPKPAAPPEIIKVSQGVTQGMILKRVQPIYPQQALQMHIHGVVLLEAVINKSGSIGKVRVLSGDAVLARAAVQAVNQWKYKPYFLNGEPVDIQTQITVNFKLPNE